MSYTHLSIIERSKLEILHSQGKSSRAIAQELGRHPSMIYRELDRVAASHPYQATGNCIPSYQVVGKVKAA
ncbi:helix-turn-helix domain-containing protein [Paenibacillus xylanexedens]|uniref:IS30 family transposase n=2 Tax=Paenibacillus xylanexedens TaxID=528191 RepID=A0ABS4RSF0_PAEXY|nr:helix-turn-helix domain-containing protein [Paenibacillus xylanexedens]MBP2245811.1 IS30 family transposase [Paenibacillus xylanexedens]